jgi:FkbM family methyltransferase
VSAVVGERSAWAAFKKKLIQFLLDQGRESEALEKIEEMAELLPDDTEAQEMKKKHSKKALADKGLKFQQVIPPSPTTHTIDEKTSCRNGCDKEFYALVERLKTEPLNQLLTAAANSVNLWLEEDYEYFGLLLKWYRSWYRVNAFAQDQGFINYFGGMYQYLKQNASELAALYESLADYRSKLTLKIMLQHWLTFHPDLRKSGTESLFEHYFDLDIIKCDENEVFVDCGCYLGDTVQEYIKQYGKYKSIYSYELTPSTYAKAKQNLAGIPRVYLRNAGVSKENGTFPFIDNIDAGNRLSPNGNVIAEVVKIDDDIGEDITFLKMDVEGAEIDALNGAEHQIRRNKPKLAISLYHKLSDLLDIPRLIKSFVPEYTLYLRNTFSPNFPFPTEYVLLAVAGQADRQTERECVWGGGM